MGTEPHSLTKSADSRAIWLGPLLTSLLCLLPLVLLWSRFQNLYWFHDDWDLISDMERLGMRDWLALRHGEHFAPLFNALWLGAIHVLGGSYSAMILLLWVTHFANLLLLAAILRRCDFSWQAISLAVVTLGMAWSNIETLGWAACWISLLATFFFLLGWFALAVGESRGGSRAFSVLAAASAAASALSFSRGVLTGVFLGLFIVLLPRAPLRPDLHRRRVLTAACLAAITVASLLPYRWMSTEYHQLQGLDSSRIAAMVSYGAHYWLLSPLIHLLPIPHKSVAMRDVMITGTCKSLILWRGFVLAELRKRAVLWMLLLLDLAMAGMLAVGRFDLDMETSVSYRYQYAALLCFAPFLGLVVTKEIERLKHMRQAAFVTFLGAWALLLGYPWARHGARWSQWRGTDVKNSLAAAPPEQRFGFADITAGRARELIRIYHLH